MLSIEEHNALVQRIRDNADSFINETNVERMVALALELSPPERDRLIPRMIERARDGHRANHFALRRLAKEFPAASIRVSPEHRRYLASVTKPPGKGIQKHFRRDTEVSILVVMVYFECKGKLRITRRGAGAVQPGASCCDVVADALPPLGYSRVSRTWNESWLKSECWLPNEKRLDPDKAAMALYAPPPKFV